MDLRFQIGDTAWRATCEIRENHIQCPDCGGTGRLRVLFHDDTMVSIDCQNCGSGYNPPTGRIRVYDRTARAELTVITGVEVHGSTVEWRCEGCWIVEDGKLFADEASAIVAAQALAVQLDSEERERILKKEKPERTWSWNAVYHRRCIKEAQRQIEYHTKKLAAANLKARDKEEAV